MIDDDMKGRWVAALRSGEYKQGRRRLRVGHTYCCLGVLADLIDCNAWLRSGDDRRGVKLWKKSSLALPEEILPAGVQEQAATFNDNGSTFEEIAGWIESGYRAHPLSKGADDAA